MLFSDSYFVIEAPKEHVLKSKGSKFLAFAFPVKSEHEIKTCLADLRKKYPDATHHCYAWVLGYDQQNYRANDDGEPANTAGKPIYRQIQRLQLANVLVVVVRYFGGTLLGVPGLIEAYGAAAAECLADCKIIEKKILEVYQLSCEFGLENEIYKLCKQYSTVIVVNSSEQAFSAEIKIPLQQSEAFKSQIKLNYKIQLKYLGIA